MGNGVTQFQVLDGLPIHDPQDDPRFDDLVQRNLTVFVGWSIWHWCFRVKHDTYTRLPISKFFSEVA